MNEIKEYTAKVFEDINIQMKLVMNIGQQENYNMFQIILNGEGLKV